MTKDTDLLELEMGLLGPGDILGGVDRATRIHCPRDIERPVALGQSPRTSQINR
jgi:hypothetical protein